MPDSSWIGPGAREVCEDAGAGGQYAPELYPGYGQLVPPSGYGQPGAYRTSSLDEDCQGGRQVRPGEPDLISRKRERG